MDRCLETSGLPQPWACMEPEGNPGFLAQPGCLCRTIRFWDLEKFQVVSCIEGEPGPVRYAGSWVVDPASSWELGYGPGWAFSISTSIPSCPGVPAASSGFSDPRSTLAWPRSVLFNPDGCCLYSGCQDSLRVYGWEPERCFDVVLVNWGKVADLAICNDQLVRKPPGLHPPSTSGPHSHPYPSRCCRGPHPSSAASCR